MFLQPPARYFRYAAKVPKSVSIFISSLRASERRAGVVAPYTRRSAFFRTSQGRADLYPVGACIARPRSPSRRGSVWPPAISIRPVGADAHIGPLRRKACKGFPLRGSWHGEAVTDEVAVGFSMCLGKTRSRGGSTSSASLRSAPSPQGEGFISEIIGTSSDCNELLEEKIRRRFICEVLSDSDS